VVDDIEKVLQGLSVVGNLSEDKQLITGYLLGALYESEQERLDEMSLTDDEFADCLRVVENDLVDSYVRGELSGDALTRFNSHYLASPGRAEKVRFAESLLAFADKAAAEQARDTWSPETTRHAGREASRWFFSLPRPALQWGLAAAALLILIGGGYLFVENLRLRDQLAQKQAERSGLELREQDLLRLLDQQRLLDAETEKELTQVRDRLAQLELQQAAGQHPGPEADERDLRVVAFVLSPQSRGIGQIATLTIPAAADYVALSLELEAEGFQDYRAALKNPATNQIVWRSGRLKPSGKDKTVRVRLPAGSLNSQNYLVELSGISARGVPENAGSYAFKVARQ
jgi:hypothetical protein